MSAQSRFNDFEGFNDFSNFGGLGAFDPLSPGYSSDSVEDLVSKWRDQLDPDARAALIQTIPDSAVSGTQTENPTANLTMISMTLLYGMLKYGGQIAVPDLYTFLPGATYKLKQAGFDKFFFEQTQDVAQQKRLSPEQVMKVLQGVDDRAVVGSQPISGGTLLETGVAYFTAALEYGNPTQKVDLYELVMPEKLSGLQRVIMKKQGIKQATPYYRLKADVLLALIEKVRYPNGRIIKSVSMPVPIMAVETISTPIEAMPALMPATMSVSESTMPFLVLAGLATIMLLSR